MQPRMKNPLTIIPEAMQGILAFTKAAKKGGLPAKTAHLVHLRASQINGCTFCVDMHSRELKTEGASDELIWAVAAWHDSTQFDDAERAALGLAEAATRLSDRSDPVPDEIWNEAKRHYDEPALASLILEIAAINTFNRINAIIRQTAGFKSA